MLIYFLSSPVLCCRYVLGYRVNSGLQSNRAKGPRPTGERMVHVVSSSMTVSQLQTLMRDKLCPDFSGEEFELQVSAAFVCEWHENPAHNTDHDIFINFKKH